MEILNQDHMKKEWIKIGDDFLRDHLISRIDTKGRFVVCDGRTYLVPRNQRNKLLKLIAK